MSTAASVRLRSALWLGLVLKVVSVKPRGAWMQGRKVEIDGESLMRLKLIR